MSWIRNKLLGFSVGINRKELEAFISNISSMDSIELGLPVAVATDVRHRLEKMGHSPMDPLTYVAVCPEFPLLMSQLTREFQKSGNNALAVGPMIWCHTARASASMELRGLGRQMWRELARGFPHVERGALMYRQLTGQELDISDYGRLPAGFDPNPA